MRKSANNPPPASQTAHAGGSSSPPAAVTANAAPNSSSGIDHFRSRRCFQSKRPPSPRAIPSSSTPNQCVAKYSAARFMRWLRFRFATFRRSVWRFERFCEASLKGDPLYPVVLAVDHVDAALAVHGERPGVVQLARLPPRPAPAAERPAVERKLLHALVAVLHYIQFVQEPVALAPECEIVRIAQLSRTFSRRAPDAD